MTKINLAYEKLALEVEELRAENSLLKKEQAEIWDTVKIMLAKISHEFKTPLNSILGFSELMTYRTKDEKLLSYSDNISSSSNHLLSLVQNIIDVTCTKYKPLEISYSLFQSGDTIEEVIQSFDTNNIRYTLINITLCADYMRFKQLVYNLISNALKYSNNKPVDIITYVEDDFFGFDITDYGDGISPEDNEKIFEFFTQVSDDKNKRNLGSGIGLALCKIIAEAHGGEICVCSERNKGATFTFKIPIRKIDML